METDILRIKSVFLRSIITKVIKHFSKKKLGIPLNIDISSIEIKSNPDNPNLIHFEISAGGDIPTKDLKQAIEEALNKDDSK